MEHIINETKKQKRLLKLVKASHDLCSAAGKICQKEDLEPEDIPRILFPALFISTNAMLDIVEKDGNVNEIKNYKDSLKELLKLLTEDLNKRLSK